MVAAETKQPPEPGIRSTGLLRRDVKQSRELTLRSRLKLVVELGVCTQKMKQTNSNIIA